MSLKSKIFFVGSLIFWPIVSVLILTLVFLLSAVMLLVCLATKKGRGKVFSFQKGLWLTALMTISWPIAVFVNFFIVSLARFTIQRAMDQNIEWTVVGPQGEERKLFFNKKKMTRLGQAL